MSNVSNSARPTWFLEEKNTGAIANMQATAPKRAFGIRGRERTRPTMPSITHSQSQAQMNSGSYAGGGMGSVQTYDPRFNRDMVSRITNKFNQGGQRWHP